MQQAKHSRASLWALIIVAMIVGFVLQGVCAFSGQVSNVEAYEKRLQPAPTATPDPRLSGPQTRIWLPIILVQAGAIPSSPTPSATPLPTATSSPTPSATPLPTSTSSPAAPLPTATLDGAAGQIRRWLPLIVGSAAQPAANTTPTTQPTPFPTLPPAASPTVLPTLAPTQSPTASATPQPAALPTPEPIPASAGDPRLFYTLVGLALIMVTAALLLWLYVNRKQAQALPAPVPAKKALPAYRLDAAFPDKVAILQTFDIAVAIRRLDAEILDKENLGSTKSRTKKLYVPSLKPYTQLSVHIAAQQCDIKGESTIEFRLYQGDESPVFAFQLIPRIVGFLNIVVTINEQDELRGEVPLLTRSLQLLTEKPGLKTASYAIKADLGHFLHKRLQELQERQAAKGVDTAPNDLLEIAAIQQQLADFEA